MRVSEPRVAPLHADESSEKAKEVMDLVFTVGQYNPVSMAMNTLGVQQDEGEPGWDV